MRYIPILFLVCGLTLFQNCSDVAFTARNSSGTLKPGNNPGNGDLQDDELEDDRDLDEVVNENIACDEALKPVHVTAPKEENVQISGASRNVVVQNAGRVTVSGAHSTIMIHKADDVTVTGYSDLLAVKSAGRVSHVSGAKGSLCLRAQNMGSISGARGFDANDSLVLVREGDGIGNVDSISGANGVTLAIINLNVGQISGAKRNIHIYGGRVERISGATGDIYLYNGASIGSISGAYGDIIPK